MHPRPRSTGSVAPCGRPLLPLLVFPAFGTAACRSTATAAAGIPTGRIRLDAIPVDALKRSLVDDDYPPVLHSSEDVDPIPLPGRINTAGLDDPPCVAPDGRFYFFFTPLASVPAEGQLFDAVTGI